VFNGVTADEFDPVVTADDATDIVYVGEFRHIKGADLLIDAVARLRADGKPVTLTLAGDGEEIEPSRLKSSDWASPGWCASSATSRRDTAFPRADCWWFLLARDSMPYVVIEAAAAGIPMIAANVGGIPEIFETHTDALFAPSNVGAMADAIETALDDPAAAWRAPNPCAKESSCIFRRRRWSKGCWRATATHLQNVNRSLPTITVSSDLSVKP
jgi:glycosyltransferase involved in cell wall biosynthesis